MALGGAIGAVGRYLSGVAALRFFGGEFPMGTLVVNVLGSFLMGVAFVYLVGRGGESSKMVPFLMTGVLGGFTTFSAFSLDLWALFDKGRIIAGSVYFGSSVGLSVLALIVGVLAFVLFPTIQTSSCGGGRRA